MEIGRVRAKIAWYRNNVASKANSAFIVVPIARKIIFAQFSFRDHVKVQKDGIG